MLYAQDEDMDLEGDIDMSQIVGVATRKSSKRQLQTADHLGETPLSARMMRILGSLTTVTQVKMLTDKISKALPDVA